jgi:hypothetical protein
VRRVWLRERVRDAQDTLCLLQLVEVVAGRVVRCWERVGVGVGTVGEEGNILYGRDGRGLAGLSPAKTHGAFSRCM